MRELHDEPIAAHTTMRVGGPAARMVVVETADELVDAVREVDDADEPLLVLGGGSNLVVADAGSQGTVVKVATRGVVVDSQDQCGGANVVVAAGEDWDGLVARAVERGVVGDRGARPASPGRPVRRRCRTSGPTARRWRRPSRGCGCGTAPSSGCAR